MEKPGFSVWGALCAVAPAAAFCAVHPSLEMGFNDDWQYIHMARTLAATGRVVYDGWTGPMALPHIFWGAALIKLCGFSFFLLRFAMLPIWVGCAVLIYKLGRWIGLPPSWAALASLSVTLSPVAIPAAACFATDTTALVLALLAIYCGVRASASSTIRWGIAWLAAAALSGALAGTTRDVYWAIPAWTIAVSIAFRRRERAFRFTGLLLLGALLAGAVLSARWHYVQLAGHNHFWQPPTWEGVSQIGPSAFVLFLTTGLMCLPVVICLIRRFSRLRAWAFGIAAFLLLQGALMALLNPRLCMAPWIGNLFTQYGAFYNGQILLGDRPVLLPPTLRLAIGLIVLAGMAIAIGGAVQVARSIRKQASGNIEQRDPFLVFIAISVPLAVGFVVLIAERNIMMFDRYLLPVAAFAALLTAGMAFRLKSRVPGIPGWTALAIMAVFGVASTHDTYAAHRATLDAAQWLTRRGVPRDRLSAGYEYDAWTQLEEKGALSEPDFSRRDFWFHPRTEVVKPRWYVVSSPQPNLGPATRIISYGTWLPPNTRTLLIQQAAAEDSAP